MMSKFEILIVYQSDPIDSKILEAIHRKGYKVSVYKNPEEIEDSLANIESPIILAYSSNDKAQANFFKHLSAFQFLKRFPVIAIAYNIAGLETELNTSFPLALTVKAPAENAKVIESIRFIERNYKTKAAESSPEEKIQQQSEESEESSILLSTSFEKADIEDQISLAKDLFEKIKGLNFNKTNFGSDSIPRILSSTAKTKALECVLPNNEQLAFFCSNFLRSLKSQTRSTIARVNNLSNLFLSPLELGEELMDLAKAAAILYSYSFAHQNRDLLQQDYAFKGGLLMRKQICSQIKDSALSLGSELANRDLNSIVASVARIIGHEEQSDNSQLAIIASAISMSDLINRKCFQMIYWNFRNAQRIVKAIRQGRFKLMHPSINCITLKFLSEALASQANLKLLGSQRLRENSDLEGSIRISEETLVDIPELQPGMTLSRSLVTESGKPILEPDVTLDHDLIIRIWQLSGICPLEKVVVRRTY